MSWKLLDMEHKTSDGFVLTVVSEYCFTYEEGSSQRSFVSEFTDNVGPDFIPYEELTEEIILSWVFEDLGAETVAETESIVKAEAIANNELINNPVLENGFPWQ